MNREIAKEQYYYPEVGKIVSETLESTYGRVILIVGQPGSGKSVFMSQLYDKFKEQDFAIRAVFFQDAYSPKDIYEWFMQVKDKNKPKVLLLDSLDVLAYSRRKELQEWLFYTNKLKEIKRMTVICAARSFEAEHLYPMNTQGWSEKIPIALLPDEFIDEVLKKVNYDYKFISPKLREFLKIPLHLKIAVEIIEKGGDPKNIFDLHGLYAKLFELLEISPNEELLLMQLSENMIEKRTTSLPYPLINTFLIDEIKKMEKRPGITGILQIDEKSQWISFSHQTLIDYLLALKLVRENKSLADFIIEHGQSLFIRPVIRHILGLLRILSHKQLFGELEKIFLKETYAKKIGYITDDDKSVKLHIKTAILANMASWNDPTDEEGKFLVRLFNKAKDGKILIEQFFHSKPTAGWYKVLKDYIDSIIKNSDETDSNFIAIILFLSDIAKEIPNEILDISLSLLKKQKKSQMFEWYLSRVFDELSKTELAGSLKKKYVYMLEQAIKNGIFSWYYDVLISCKRITKYDPLKALNLYVDYIRKELQFTPERENLTESFNEILPLIYEKKPDDTLLIITDFFEEIFTDRYVGTKRLWDYPNDLLYSRYEQLFGLRALYEWYKNKILEACSNINELTKKIIEKLEQSKWETQKQLSMLCKLKNIRFYKDNIMDYVKKILTSDLTDPYMYIQSELFIRAINKILGVIEEKERNEIINKILNLDLKDKDQVWMWIWKPLHHISDEYRNEKVKEKLEEINGKFSFGEYKYTLPFEGSSVKTVQPIIAADELRLKSPKELYEFLIKNSNLKPFWDLENDIFYGGVEYSANEVAKIFVEDLPNYKDIINKLANDPSNDVYIKSLFFEISQKEIILQEHIDWLIDIINSLYKRENLQIAIIYILERTIRFLTQEHFNKIKNIFLELSESKDPETDKFFEYKKQGYSNGSALSEGLNSVRGALVRLVILLASKFSNNSILLGILKKLSIDNTISVRAVLVEHLPYIIKPLGWDKCYELFSNAFKKEPEAYADSISNFLKYVPGNKFNEIGSVLNKIWEKRKGELGKSYAILMSIYYFRGLVPEEKLMKIFTDNELIDEGKKEAFNLIGNQVAFEENVDKCLKIVDKLLEKNLLNGKISTLFIRARPEDFKKFESIIKKIIKKPELRGEALYYILEYLEKSTLFDPLAVFTVLENILSNIGDDFHNLRNYIPASHSEAPLNIINTILECYPEEENRALEALSKLIESKWEGVDEYLRALDRI